MLLATAGNRQPVFSYKSALAFTSFFTRFLDRHLISLDGNFYNAALSTGEMSLSNYTAVIALIVFAVVSAGAQSLAPAPSPTSDGNFTPRFECRNYSYIIFLETRFPQLLFSHFFRIDLIVYDHEH